MNIDALREAIRVVIDHGQGERLLGMLAESDPAGPNWPLLAALRARVRGEAEFRNLCPEAQGVTRDLFERLGG